MEITDEQITAYAKWILDRTDTPTDEIEWLVKMALGNDSTSGTDDYANLEDSRENLIQIIKDVQ
jgi:hypothetical protein